MLSLHELDALARERYRTRLAEADARRTVGAIPGAPVREALAAALIALAVWLAPAAHAGYQPAHPRP